MADIATTIVSNLNSAGLPSLFPFLLSLAIFYGLLHYTLKEQLPKSARALISLVASFFVLIYTASNPSMINFFTQMFGDFMIVAIGFLVVIILLGLVGFKPKELFTEGKHIKWVAALVIVFIGAVIAFGAGATTFLNIPVTSQFWTVILFIIIIGVVVFWMASEGEKEGAPPAGKKEGG